MIKDINITAEKLETLDEQAINHWKQAIERGGTVVERIEDGQAFTEIEHTVETLCVELKEKYEVALQEGKEVHLIVEASVPKAKAGDCYWWVFWC